MSYYNTLPADVRAAKLAEIEARRIHLETPERMTMRNVLKLAGGKIVGVTFRKIDGSMRSMTCRVTGDDTTKKYMTVFDMRKRGYRRVNLDSIYSIRMNGIEMKVM